MGTEQNEVVEKNLNKRHVDDGEVPRSPHPSLDDPSQRGRKRRASIYSLFEAFHTS